MSGGLGIVDVALLIPVILAADVVLAVVLMTVLGEGQSLSDRIENDLVGRRALIITCGAGVVSGVIWILRFL